MSSQMNGLCEFGPFRLDPAERLLLRGSQSVPLTPKAFEVLVTLVARPGRLISKEELLKQVWPDTFVEEANLSYNVSLLRKALGDEVAPHRYIETVTKRGYRFTSNVRKCEPPIAAEPEVPVDNPGAAQKLGAGRSRLSARVYKWGLIAAFAVAVALVAGLVAMHRLEWGRPPAVKTTGGAIVRQLSRVTFDAGLQEFPTWSPDGRQIAYASNRSGNEDIWVQQIAGGPPMRLTSDPAADWQPDWSPDGRHIVFRSEREGGGLFVMSALGGAARRLTAFGYRPMWSPDGTRVLFYETPMRYPRFVPPLFVVRDDGSAPTRVLDALPRPLDTWCWRGLGWHPDGRRVSVFWGGPRDRPDALAGSGGWNFWTFSLDDGTVIRSEIPAEAMRRLDAGFTGNSGSYGALRWAPSGDALYLQAGDGHVHTVWRVMVDPVTLRWVAGPERLTTGPGSATGIALSADGHHLAFGAWNATIRLWSLPLDPTAAQVTGNGRVLTDPETPAISPDLSSDGHRLVYIDGQDQLRIRSVTTGEERLLFERDDFHRMFPRWSRDGTSLLYTRSYRGRLGTWALVRTDVNNGREELLTTPGSDAWIHGDWTADRRWVVGSIVTQSPKRWQIALLPTSAAPRAETQARVIAQDPSRNLFPHQLSPDDRWVALSGSAAVGNGGAAVFVVPITGGPLMRVADGPSWEWQDHIRWARDGRAVYFVSDRSGFFNVWARRFDPHTGPVGPLVRLTQLDNPARTLWPIPGGEQLAIAVSQDRLVLSIWERTGNIWMMDGVDH